jgi:hypothetical protein
LALILAASTNLDKVIPELLAYDNDVQEATKERDLEDAIKAASHTDADESLQILVAGNRQRESVYVNSALSRAAAKGSSERLQKLLERSRVEDIAISIENRENAVQMAVRAGSSNCLDILLRSGPVSARGRILAMGMAVRAGNPKQLDMILKDSREKGIVIPPNELGELMGEAASRDQFDCLEILLASGPIPSKYFKIGLRMSILSPSYPLLSKTISNESYPNHMKVVQELLARAPLSEEDRESLIHGVIKETRIAGSLSSVHYSIYKDDPEGLSSEAKRLKLLQMLVESGPITEKARGAAVVAAVEKHVGDCLINIVKVLMAGGAKISDEDCKRVYDILLDWGRVYEEKVIKEFEVILPRQSLCIIM